MWKIDTVKAEHREVADADTLVMRRSESAAHKWCRCISDNAPSAKLPRLMQYTAIGSSSLSPSFLTVNRTNMRSIMSPMQSKGSDKVSCHTGLKPLFLSTLVRQVTVRGIADPPMLVEEVPYKDVCECE